MQQYSPEYLQRQWALWQLTSHHMTGHHMIVTYLSYDGVLTATKPIGAADVLGYTAA